MVKVVKNVKIVKIPYKILYFEYLGGFCPGLSLPRFVNNSLFAF